jgi:hypothetical protein
MSNQSKNSKAPESFVAKVQAAVLAYDPQEIATFDELAAKKAAYYIYFGAGIEDQLHNVTDDYIYNVYDVIKFVSSYKDGE